MKSLVLVTCFTFAFAIAVEKATGAVFQNSVSLEPRVLGPNNIWAWTQPNLGGLGAGLGLNIDQFGVMTPGGETIGIGHAWYAVGFGTLLTPVYASTHAPFASVFTPSNGSIQTTLDVPFYLGFWLDANNSHSPELGDCFGWALLKRTTTGLVLVDNAIENQGTGIRVGTTTQVPEPGCCVMLLLSAVFVSGRRRGCVSANAAAAQ